MDSLINSEDADFYIFTFEHSNNGREVGKGNTDGVMI